MAKSVNAGTRVRVPTAASPVEQRVSVVRHTSTNTGVVVAIVLWFAFVGRGASLIGG